MKGERNEDPYRKARRKVIGVLFRCGNGKSFIFGLGARPGHSRFFLCAPREKICAKENRVSSSGAAIIRASSFHFFEYNGRAFMVLVGVRGKESRRVISGKGLGRVSYHGDGPS